MTYGRKRWLLAGCLLALSVGVAGAQTVTLRGFVTDASDGQALQGANVVVDRLGDAEVFGAAVGRDGFYRLSGLAPGRYAFRVTFVGYAPAVDTLVLGGEPFVTRNVALDPAEEALGEVVVAADGGAARLDGGLQTVRPTDLARIPTPDLSGDLASYLQSLPGIISIGDRGGQLFIRGGTPAQNLVLVDGVPIYQPFHIIGFFSAFPQDLVAQADVYAGGFGARYSGRISSVIDVSMREGNMQAVEGAASVSPFLAAVRAEGPLRRGALSLLTSFRSSIIERTAPSLLDEELPLQFSDLFVKVQHAGRDRSRCSASLMLTYDRGRIDARNVERGDVFRWRNVVTGGRCIAFPAAAPVLFELSTGVSYVQNDVGEALHPERSSNALLFNTEINLTRFLGKGEVSGGFVATANWLGYRLADQFVNVRRSDDFLLGAGVYLEAKRRFRYGFSLTPGLALVGHPGEYAPSLEPRLRAGWAPAGEDGPFALNAALGLYRQTVEGISDERDAGSVFVTWIPVPVGTSRAQAFHALGGGRLRLGPLRLAAEGYYKRLDDLAVPIWSQIARFTVQLASATGDVRGVDTRLELQRRPFYLYLGYGLSETTYTIDLAGTGLPFDDAEQRYNPPHDRRHQVNAVLSVERGRFAANVHWQFGSGLPYTRPFGFDDLIRFDQGVPDVRRARRIPRILFDRPYTGRLPTYHRLDVSAEQGFDVGAARVTLQAGAINVYDRTNLFYFDIFTVRRVDQLPFVPYLALKLETR